MKKMKDDRREVYFTLKQPLDWKGQKDKKNKIQIWITPETAYI